jgi:hypothetical protein
MNWDAFWQQAALGGAAAMGTFLLWARWTTRNRLTFWRLSDALRRWFGKSVACEIIELGAFLAFGVFVALVVVGVETSRQAFSAGLGWTGLVAQVSPSRAR